MSPTPIHGTKAESEAAHMHRCENEEGGPVCSLKRELATVKDELGGVRLAMVKLETTFWTGIKAGAALLSVLTLAVGVLAYLSTARSAPSRLVPQAHAETKGSP